MLKISNKEVSPDLKAERQERDALLGEKNILQAEMVELGKTNKRLKSEIGELEEQNTVLGNQKLHIERLVKDLLVLKSKHEQEIKDLDGQYAYRKSVLEASLPDIKKVLADLELKKLPIQTEIDKLASVKELSKKEIISIEEKIKNAKTSLLDITTSTEHKSFRENILSLSIGKKEKELEKLEEQVSKKEAIVSEVKKNEIILDNLKKEIEETETKFILTKNEIKKSLETENEGLKKSIETNKQINRQEESLHISLLNKNKVLDNREAFIKGQYERAGIKWE